MKKIILLLAFGFVSNSCKTPAPIVSNAIDRKSQIAIKGNWTLNTVSYAGSEMFPVTSFEIADSKCFEGSIWNFVSNNDSGDVTLVKANCKSYASKITWYVNKDGQFVLKLLNDGDKPRKVKQGYILKVADQTMESFKLLDNINIGGKSTNIVYSFRKN